MKIRIPGLSPANELPLGARVEDDACRWLKQNGLRILERNYRCRFGEIDIIARDAETLVFVEVRYRGNARFGSAAESVTDRKQRKVATTAAHYLQSHPLENPRACRFDVLAAHQHHSKGRFDFTWHKNAFYGND